MTGPGPNVEWTPAAPPRIDTSTLGGAGNEPPVYNAPLSLAAQQLVPDVPRAVVEKAVEIVATVRVNGLGDALAAALVAEALDAAARGRNGKPAT